MSKQIGASPKYRKYSPSKLQSAIDMVGQGMSKKKAAQTFGIPRTTLLDKLSGKAPLGIPPGRATVLTSAEEEVLVNYCKLMSGIGYPLKRAELLVQVKQVLDHDGRDTPFNNNLPGPDWYRGFIKRHPVLAERTPMTLGHQRANINKEMIDGWFCGLRSYLKREVKDWETLIKDPRRIFNAAESGFPLCVKSGRVLAEKGLKHLYQVSSSTKLQLTVMACFSAIGNYLPPLIVYPGERFWDAGIEAFPEAIYGHTESGWMDSNLFVEFLRHLSSFIDMLIIPKPVILFVDGHSTHMSLDASKFCRENGIILYCLLPNATHVLQACDIGFFGPLKSAWKKEVKLWQLDHLGESFTKKAFPGVFKKAWYRVTKLENAVHGFHRCALFPLNKDNIDLRLNPSKISKKVEQPCDTANQCNSDNPPNPDDNNNSVPDLHLQSAGTTITHAENLTPETSNTSIEMIGERPSVSRSFNILAVPEIKEKPKERGKMIREKLPKALSGTEALRILQERADAKKAEEETKLKRKQERELKKQHKAEEQEVKRQKREEMKKKREEMKKMKEELKQKRQAEKQLKRIKSSKKKKISRDLTSSSSSESEQPEYLDSDHDYDEKHLCPGCESDEGGNDKWISCTTCPRRWHMTCTGDSILLEIQPELVNNYPFKCEHCINI